MAVSIVSFKSGEWEVEMAYVEGDDVDGFISKFPLTLRAVRRPYGSRIDLYGFIEKPQQSGNSTSVVITLVLEHVEANYEARPFTSINDTAAQILMDELWNCGIRPTEGTGSAGSLAATQAHLSDMRKIAFGLLDREPVSEVVEFRQEPRDSMGT